MANALFKHGRTKFAQGAINWSLSGGSTIKAFLVDLEDLPAARKITAATAASPIVVTTASVHGLSTGDKVSIGYGLGMTAINGIWPIIVTSTTQFSLTGSVGAGTYTASSAWMVPIGNTTGTLDNIDDIPTIARTAVGTLQNLVDATDGVLDAADLVLPSVAGDVSEAIIIAKQGATDGDSPLIAYIDTATGLPATPNGGNMTITWDNGPNKIARI